MRILYHSVVPWKHTGYATCTEEIATRLHNNGHEVAIQCLNSIRDGPIEWDGWGSDADPDTSITVYGSQGQFGLHDVEDNFEDFNADFYFTHFDTWMSPAKDMIPEFDIPYSSYVIVDHEPAPEAIVQQVSEAHEVISMSQFATNQLSNKEVQARYIPHGVDTEIYEPLSDKQRVDSVTVGNAEEEKMVDVEDRFIVGMIAANHGERKNIPAHMTAFKQFVDKVDDKALLYIHSERNSSNGFNLEQVRKEVGLPKENILMTPPDMYGEVDNAYLCRLYDMFDVFVNCSMGESWGLTVTEAQACGTPAIVTNFSSMPEQLGVPYLEEEAEQHTTEVAPGVLEAGHGLLCEPEVDYWKHRVDSKQKVVKSDTILKAINYYYENRELVEEHGNMAREHVVEKYDWEESVYPRFERFFNTMEEVLV